MSEPVIRLLCQEDKEKFTAFFDQMGPDARLFFNRHNGNQDWAMRFFTGTETQDILRWVAVDGEEIVGYVFLWDINTSIPWLGIAVAERMRGQHFGEKLITYAKEWAIAHNKGGILLTTHLANLRAQTLYERCGFQRMGIDNTNLELLYLLRF